MPSNEPNELQTRVDVAIFTVRDFWTLARSDNPRLEVAVTVRNENPFIGWHTLPSAVLLVNRDDAGEMDHSDQDTAERVIRETLRVHPAHLQQLFAGYSKTLDPRGPTTVITYIALVPFDQIDYFKAKDVTFYPIDELPKLPFDQSINVARAVEFVRDRARHSSLPALLMPELFTIKELRNLYAAVLKRDIHVSNFGKKIEEWGVLSTVSGDSQQAEAVKARAPSATGRPPQVFRLKGGAVVSFERAAF